MVAVRSAHLNKSEEFKLESWVSGLNQDNKTSNKLLEVYKQCEAHLKFKEEATLMIWRGR